MCLRPENLASQIDPEYIKSANKRTAEDLVQVLMKKKLNLIGLIIRMDSSRKIINVKMGIMEGNQRRLRPCREWLDDIGD